MNDHLASNADIVYNAAFESALVKIQRGDERLLTVAEAKQVKQFLRTNIQPRNLKIMQPAFFATQSE
jgi:hypothetical protein